MASWCWSAVALTVFVLDVSACASKNSPGAPPAAAASSESEVSSSASPLPPLSVTVPGGEAGIGFDDLRYSTELRRVLVPGGRSGVVALVDPESGSVDAISGFSKDATKFAGGHDFGVTSVDVAHGMLFATDRTTQQLHVVDLAAKKIVRSAKLASEPDYVRWVESTRELWVTEPSADQIEIFSLGEGASPALESSATIPVKNGPESLVIDGARGRAYTHHWDSSTIAIDLQTRAVVTEWPNGCIGSRGIALDDSRGFLFAVCSEGKVAVLDAARDGRILGTATYGGGFDVVGYSAAKKHLYAAGGSCKCLATFAVDDHGAVALANAKPAVAGTHCAVADDLGNAWFCDPKAGAVTRVPDSN